VLRGDGMTVINVFYKKQTWSFWVVWACTSKEEAERVRLWLRNLEYELRDKE
jgi:hypothetical protein